MHGPAVLLIFVLIYADNVFKTADADMWCTGSFESNGKKITCSSIVRPRDCSSWGDIAAKNCAVCGECTAAKKTAETCREDFFSTVTYEEVFCKEKGKAICHKDSDAVKYCEICDECTPPKKIAAPKKTAELKEKKDLKGSVDLECHELNFTATFKKEMLVRKEDTKAKVLSIEIPACPKQYDVDMDTNTVSTSFNRCKRDGGVTMNAKSILQEAIVEVTTGINDKMVKRQVVYTFTLQCKFDRELKISTKNVLNVTDEAKTFEKTRTTEFEAGMKLYTSPEFDKEVDPKTKPEYKSFQPIYLQIKGENNNPEFKFVVTDCFATGTADIDDKVRYLFYTKKCGVDDTFEELKKKTEHKFSFKIDAFTFMKLKTEVNFHCTLLVCRHNNTVTPACQQVNPDCPEKSRDAPYESKRGYADTAADTTDTGIMDTFTVKSPAVYWKKDQDVKAESKRGIRMRFQDKLYKKLQQLEDEISTYANGLN